MSPITSSNSNQDTPPVAPAAAPATDALASESTFLRLLVSQLQNQDPLNPTDSTTFVSQLTAYSQLEQLIGINKNTAPVTTPPDTGTDTGADKKTPAV